LRFVRYADDFVVMCRSEPRAQEALIAVRHHLADRLGLTLSPEKTHVTTFKKGFSFLGFDISSRSVTMRDKSVEKFKDKVRALTRRSRNMDQEAIDKLNRVIRGTANYFATPFSHNRWLFGHLDRWIRMRLRCMKYKRNGSRITNASVSSTCGVSDCSAFATSIRRLRKASATTPPRGNFRRSRPTP